MKNLDCTLLHNRYLDSNINSMFCKYDNFGRNMLFSLFLHKKHKKGSERWNNGARKRVSGACTQKLVVVCYINMVLCGIAKNIYGEF